MNQNKSLALKPVDKLKSIINQPTVQEQFKNALGKHSDLFVASLIDVFNSGLQKYDASGIIQEALKAAVLKLPISKSLGFAYLVPYKGKVQFQIGYKGLIQLVMRSGQVKTLNAGSVYEGEFKKFDKLTGAIDLSGKKTSDKAAGYFVYMELINSFQKTEFWTKERVIEHAKAKSPSYKSKNSAWFTDFDAMATKTVLRSMLSKYAPMSVEFLTVASIGYNDNETEPSKPVVVDLENLTNSGQSERAEKEQPEPKGRPEKLGNVLTEDEQKQVEIDEFNELTGN